MQSITVDGFASAICGLLQEELEVVNKNADQIAEEVAKETAEVVRQNAGENTGKYKKSIGITVEHTATGKIYNIHAKKGRYRLTHLLEDGHKTRLKHGRYGTAAKTRAYPHFIKGQIYADKRFDEKVKEIVK